VIRLYAESEMTQTDMAPESGARPLRLLIVNPNIVTKREHMHIGIPTVASYVKTHSRHEVRILDFMATSHRSWRSRLEKTLADYRPDLVGMYISTPYFPVAREVAAAIKNCSKVPIVAGGHHATLAPEAILADPHFDWLIEGEGERPTVLLLDALAADAPLTDVPGLWWREDGRLRSVPKAPLLDSKEIPTIDWTLFGDEILCANFFIWGILPVMASRGCPSKCSFCSITEVQKRYPGEKFLRYRDPRQVVTEIEADYEKYRHLGLRIVEFTDLNFLMNVKWLREFTTEYRKSGLHRKLPWSAFTRPDQATPAAIECLRDSGCVNLRVGIEAANPVMRNLVYQKNISQEVLEAGLKRIKDAGISITGYFMVGGPGERPEWLLESLDMAHRIGVDFPVFFLYKPLAGSEVLKRAASLGSFVREDAKEKAGDLLHGVTMSHRHIEAWQLTAFLLITQAAFGVPMVRWQIGRAGLSWFKQLARHMGKALRMGFTPYGAFTYFVYYGENHRTEPFNAAAKPEPSITWRGLMALARTLLPPSGAPAPTDEAAFRSLSRGHGD
jgi:radical SAM superfamily enzyme YgiQ (UPF0313 family)